MRKIFLKILILSWILTCTVTSATAQVSIGIGLPNVSIGINLPLFPELVPVPGYPVYYAPRLNSNYFFYDGMYWVYQDDNWYASSWYNGPWWYVEPEVVPVFILRIPVRYYRQPPVYFRGWYANAPPRWGHHWGHAWEKRRKGWDHWKRSSVPARAPLPVYQRQYSGERYPRFEQQQTLRNQHYRYEPRNRVVREHYRQVERRMPEPAQRRIQEEPQMKSPEQQDIRRSVPMEQVNPASPRSLPATRRGGEDMERSVPIQTPSRQREMHEQRPPRVEQRELQIPRSQRQEERSDGRGRSQEHQRGHGQDGERGGRGRD